MQPVDDLRGRWDGFAQDRYRRHRRGLLVPGRILFDLATLSEDRPFGLVAGRADLRGLPLTHVFVVGQTIGGTDLSHAAWDRVVLNGTDLSDSALDSSELTDCVFRASTFRSCTFDGGRMVRTSLAVRGGRFDHCSFLGTSFTGGNFGSAAMTGCAFDVAGGSFDPRAAAFERCAFHGAVRDVRFRNGWPVPSDSRREGPAPANTMRHVDVSGAELHDVAFHDIDLGDVIIDHHRQVLIRDWPRVAGALRARANPEPGPDNAILELSHGVYDDQRQHILDRSFLDAAYTPDAVTELRDALGDLGVELP